MDGPRTPDNFPRFEVGDRLLNKPRSERWLLYAATGILAFPTWGVLYLAGVVLASGHLAIGIYCVGLFLFLLFTWDYLLSYALLVGTPREVLLSEAEIRGVLVPPRWSSVKRGRVTFRSPIFRIPRAWYPVDGIRWESVSLSALAPARTSDGSPRGAIVWPLPARRDCGGSLLFRDHMYKVPEESFARIAESILGEGGHVEIRTSRRLPHPESVSQSVARFGAASHRGQRFALNPRLTAQEIRAVLAALEDPASSP
jgi:hypothetical protein